MATKKIKGITIELSADTSKFVKAINDVDRTLKTTQTSLKDIKKLLKLDPSNTELLKQKQELLNNAIQDTDSRLKTLKDAYNQLKNADNSSETTEQQKALAREIVETEQKLKSLKEQMREFGSVASQQLKVVGDKVKDVGDKMSTFGGKLTTRVTTPIVTAFTVSAKVASDYEENINKMDVAFGEYADHVREFTDNAYLDYGLSKVDASDVASSFGAMAKGIGFANEEASEMSVALTGLSADLASYFNTDVETAGTALEGIFTGNAQALKKFGVVLTDANLEEFALSVGMTSKEFKNLTPQQKTLLRFNYVMSQTADAQGDFARTNDNMANASRTLQASLKDLATAIGSKLLPKLVPVIQRVTEIIHKVSELDPNLIQQVVKIGAVVAAIGPVILIVGKVISTIGTLITIIGNVLGVISTVISVLGGPLTLAITAIIAVGVLLYKNWNTIKQKGIELWRSISEAFNNIKNAISEKVESAKNIASNAFESMKNSVVNKMESAKNSISNVFNNIKNAISEKMESAKNTVANVIERIKGLFNFSWSLPKIKLPHFKTTGSFGWSWGGGVTLPKISVDWYAKAMKNGMILNNPTIFGAMNGKLLGAGEAGSETIVGTNSLMNMIKQASQGMTVNMTINAQDQNVYQLADLVIDRLVATTRAERKVFQ